MSAAVRYEMEQLKAEGNAINKEIGQLKKVNFALDSTIT